MRGCGYVLWLIFALGCGAEPQNVDLVLKNASVYTLNSLQPEAQALAIAGGRIVAVGSDADVSSRYVGAAELDLDGQMVLPGFIDSHTHPVEGGVELARCVLNDIATVDAILAKVAACNAADPGTGWLLGSGWNLGLFVAANPNKTSLDEIAPDRPILLGGEDGHSSWVNSRALQLAHIGADTPDPPNGVIERDPATGEPSGTLREAAQALLEAVVPPPSAADRQAGLLRALAIANGFGITSMIEAAAGSDELAAYRAVDADGKLTARVVVSVAVDERDADALMRPEDRSSTARVRVDAAKIFVDGVLEGETAALLEPYLDRPGHMGPLKRSPEELDALVTALDKRGIQVHMHAIGDRAVRVALDAVAAARATNGPSENRHHIAHLQLVDPADRPRFAELGVIANVQGLWAYPDAYITNVNLPQVGVQRVAAMYPFGSLARAGATIVGGSDWNVTSMNPLLAIETAITRSDPSGVVPGVLNKDEALTLPQMLAAYTKNGAYLMHRERDLGSIEVGKLADLVILERNLFDVPPDQIGEVAVVRTLLEGATVYERQSSPTAR